MPRAILKFEQYPGSDFVAAVMHEGRFEYDAKRMEFTFDGVSDPTISGVEYWHDDLMLGTHLMELKFPYLWIEEADDSRSVTVVEPKLSVDFTVGLSNDDSFMIRLSQARDSEYMKQVDQAFEIFQRIMNAEQKRATPALEQAPMASFMSLKILSAASPHRMVGFLSLGRAQTDLRRFWLTRRRDRLCERSMSGEICWDLSSARSGSLIVLARPIRNFVST